LAEVYTSDVTIIEIEISIF